MHWNNNVSVTRFITIRFTALVWNGTHKISKVCLHILLQIFCLGQFRLHSFLPSS